MSSWFHRITAGIGALAFAAIVWFAGPMIKVGDARPFDDSIVRALIVCLALAAFAASHCISWLRQYRSEKVLTDAMRGGGDADGETTIFAKNMIDAFDALKRSGGRQAVLYDRPWYVVLGPSESGKTTALANSGLGFPAHRDNELRPAEGTGGTRNCDWWLSDDAVLLDMPGRYATSGGDADTDRKTWFGFLDLLKRSRPAQPINGIIVTTSLKDLMTLSEQDIHRHALSLQNRLAELRHRLNMDFPVYMLFTKADLIAGFTEYFGSIAENQRREVWGHTFQLEVMGGDGIASLPAAFNALVTRLSEGVSDRLEEETDSLARVGIFSFPAQFASLRDMINAYLNTIFDGTKGGGNGLLRGFYFSSGTQEGAPFDQLLGITAKFREHDAGASCSEAGNGYFLHDLLKWVIFREAGLVTGKTGTTSRSTTMRFMSFALIGLASLFIAGALSWSYISNKVLLAETRRAIIEYRTIARPVLQDTVVTAADFHVVLDLLNRTRALPAGYEDRTAGTPGHERFGLSQRRRLNSASVTAYRDALEGVFRPRLLVRLEQQIEANFNDPVFVYEATKVYLMLGGKAPTMDSEKIVAWMSRDWKEELYRGAANAAGRQDLELHLRAMLDLNIGRNVRSQLNSLLLAKAQRNLARMTPARLAYTLIGSSAGNAAVEDWKPAAAGGANFATVFETVDGSALTSLRVPGLYTHIGFRDHVLPRLKQVEEMLRDERWVLDAGFTPSVVDRPMSNLRPDVLALYSRDYIAGWEGLLSNLRIRSVTADRPHYSVLNRMASATSPVRALFEAIARETGKDQLSDLAEIEARFEPYRELVSGDPGRRRIDRLIRIFSDTNRNLVAPVSNQSAAEPVPSGVKGNLADLRALAADLPDALARMILMIVEELDSHAATFR